MADVQKENGYTPIANEILEQLVRLSLNGTQWRIIAVIWRYTYGFSRKEHEISINFLIRALGMQTTQYKQISRELKSLIAEGILVETKKPGKNSSRVLAFNKDYDHWTKKATGQIRPEDELDHREWTKETREPLDELDHQENKVKTNIKTNTVDAFFDAVWSIYPCKRGKGQVKAAARKRLYDIGSEEIERAINRYLADLKKDDWRKPQNGSTFFNSGYIDYLDTNYSYTEKQTTATAPKPFVPISELVEYPAGSGQYRPKSEVPVCMTF